MQTGNLKRAGGRVRTSIWLAAMAVAGLAVSAAAQAPRANGTVKATADHSLTVTTTAGDITVAVAEDAKVLDVAPGSTNLAAATPGTFADIVVGDKVIVNGTAGDSATELHAARVIVMKAAAIATAHAADEAAWAQGGGGLVKSVDATTGTVVVSSAAKTITVTTTPATKFRRYSGDSVRFEDAVASKFADIRAGDQLRVRGAKSGDGASIAAEEIVTGEFRNFSGLVTAIDGAAGTLTLKDLATKKTVTVVISHNSDVRRLPEMAAQMFAQRAAGANAPGGAAAKNAAATQGASTAAASGPGGRARAGADLSQMIAKLPTETLAGLKVGDAVMIVATQPPAQTANPTAVTLLVGVDAILRAAPSGDMTLTPWSVGGDAPSGGA